MRALLCRQLGSLDNLEVGDIPAPTLTAGEVRIGVKASGVNFPDMLMVEGKYQVKPELPFVPGLELAGEVLECAPDVARGYDLETVLWRSQGSRAPTLTRLFFRPAMSPSSPIRWSLCRRQRFR